MKQRGNGAWGLLIFCVLLQCGEVPAPPSTDKEPRAILLITLDTTRADVMGTGADAADTPAWDALAREGTVFQQAYAPAPTTLPSHTTMMTGLLPADTGIHENGRTLGEDLPLLAPQLQRKGFTTAAFVSAYPLAAATGLARGFDHYDDALPADRAERRGDVTAAAAQRFISQATGDVFLWVHFFDAHFPYEAPGTAEAAGDLRAAYRAEVTFADRQMGALVTAFREAYPRAYVIVAGDHGEGLGDHGEAQHGHLAYNTTLHVPLLIAGPGIEAGSVVHPVGLAQLSATLLGLAENDTTAGLLGDAPRVVLSEAMKPYLQFGWAPQVAAVHGSWKYILANEWEAYDLAQDPGETHDLFAEHPPPPEVVRAVNNYPLPGAQPTDADAPAAADAERLASLGYAGPSAGPPPRDSRPAPVEMTALFQPLDQASGLFSRGRYGAVIPVFERILAADPANLSVLLRLAVAHSLLDQWQAAARYFDRAVRMAPENADVRHYLGKHLQRLGEWDAAGEQFEIALRLDGGRARTEAALGAVRERQGRRAEALALYREAAPRLQDGALYAAMGRLAMGMRQTQAAIRAFERAQNMQGESFTYHLELGALYLDARRPQDAAQAFEQVPTDHPRFALALYKRAQTAALLRADDVRDWVQAALASGDADVVQLVRGDPLLKPFLKLAGKEAL